MIKFSHRMEGVMPDVCITFSMSEDQAPTAFANGVKIRKVGR